MGLFKEFAFGYAMALSPRKGIQDAQAGQEV